ncbi:MAG: hypothetical protein CVV58_01480, partial [Tenericutes bacterium HGW-Tenericutes-3]
MKQLGFLMILMLFVLSGCQTIRITSDLIEIEQKLTAFENGSNQFKMVTEIILDIAYEDNQESLTETFTSYVQNDPYYFQMTYGGVTTLEFLDGDLISTVIFDQEDQVLGKQLYQISQYLPEETYQEIEELDFDLSKVDIRETEKNRYEMSSKLYDFLPESVVEELETLLIQA